MNGTAAAGVPATEKHHAEPADREEVRRIDDKDATEVTLRADIVMVAQFTQRQVQQSIDVRRVEGDGPRVERFGFLGAWNREGGQDDAEIVPRARVLGHLRDRVAPHCFRIVVQRAPLTPAGRKHKYQGHTPLPRPAAVRGDDWRGRLTCCATADVAVAASTRTTPMMITAASGRYIRRSATSSSSSGTTLEDGARIRKNHAPRKPSHPHRFARVHAATVIDPSTATSTKPGTPSQCATG